MLDSRVVNFLAVVIPVAWLCTLVLRAYDHAYTPPPEVAKLMMMLAGACFGHFVVSMRERSKRDEGEPPDREAKK